MASISTTSVTHIQESGRCYLVCALLSIHETCPVLWHILWTYLFCLKIWSILALFWELHLAPVNEPLRTLTHLLFTFVMLSKPYLWGVRVLIYEDEPKNKVLIDHFFLMLFFANQRILLLSQTGTAYRFLVTKKRQEWRSWKRGLTPCQQCSAPANRNTTSVPFWIMENMTVCGSKLGLSKASR